MVQLTKKAVEPPSPSHAPPLQAWQECGEPGGRGCSPSPLFWCTSQRVGSGHGSIHLFLGSGQVTDPVLQRPRPASKEMERGRVWLPPWVPQV